MSDAPQTSPPGKPNRLRIVLLLVVLAAIAAVAVAALLWQQARGELDDAVALYEAKRFDEAEAKFRKVLTRKPDTPMALLYLGAMAEARGDLDGAIVLYKQGLEIDPNSPQFAWNLAHIYFDKKHDYDGAEKYCLHAMKLGLKAQYRLLYALCAVEKGAPKEEITQRLRDTVSMAGAQAQSLDAEALDVNGSLAKVWAETAKRLAAEGDNFGYDELERLSQEATKEHLRTFAAQMLVKHRTP